MLFLQTLYNLDVGSLLNTFLKNPTCIHTLHKKGRKHRKRRRSQGHNTLASQLSSASIMATSSESLIISIRAISRFAAMLTWILVSADWS